MSGKFIVFEGLDGSGKSTQARLLISALNEMGKEAIYTREPGGCDLAERIRLLLLKDEGVSDPMIEFLLLSAARKAHVDETIRPALLNGKFVICDRFYGSSLAYQCYGKGINLDFAWNITAEVIQKCEPDITFLLSLPIEFVKKRIELRALENNCYDFQSQDFYDRINDAFHKIATQHSNWHIIDATLSENVILKHIMEIIYSL